MSVCNVTLAIPRNYKNSEGAYETDFVTCVCFKHNAERVAEYCQKGDMIGIQGMIQNKNYEKDGIKVYSYEIIAEKINFLSAKPKEEQKKEEVVEDPFESFSQEADLSGIEISSDNLPF